MPRFASADAPPTQPIPTRTTGPHSGEPTHHEERTLPCDVIVGSPPPNQCDTYSVMTKCTSVMVHMSFGHAGITKPRKHEAAPLLAPSAIAAPAASAREASTASAIPGFACLPCAGLLAAATCVVGPTVCHNVRRQAAAVLSANGMMQSAALAQHSRLLPAGEATDGWAAVHVRRRGRRVRARVRQTHRRDCPLLATSAGWAAASRAPRPLPSEGQRRRLAASAAGARGIAAHTLAATAARHPPRGRSTSPPCGRSALGPWGRGTRAAAAPPCTAAPSSPPPCGVGPAARAAAAGMRRPHASPAAARSAGSAPPAAWRAGGPGARAEFQRPPATKRAMGGGGERVSACCDADVSTRAHKN